MGRKKSKSVKVKKGSRLKLKSGEFAMAQETPESHATTVEVKVYTGKGRTILNLAKDNFTRIPIGQIAEVVRY